MYLVGGLEEEEVREGELKDKSALRGATEAWPRA